MELYPLLRLLHFAGFISLGGGLLAVFASEWRAYRTDGAMAFAEAARYTAAFYQTMVLPGAILIGVSGPLLMRHLGLGIFDAPWLVGMWGLFVFEFLEGNTVTRIQFRRTLRLSQALVRSTSLAEEERLGQIAHFLDIPLFSAIIYCGVMRPSHWGPVGTAIGIGLIMAGLLTVLVPRMARRRRSD